MKLPEGVEMWVLDYSDELNSDESRCMDISCRIREVLEQNFERASAEWFPPDREPQIDEIKMAVKMGFRTWLDNVAVRCDEEEQGSLVEIIDYVYPPEDLTDRAVIGQPMFDRYRTQAAEALGMNWIGVLAGLRRSMPEGEIKVTPGLIPVLFPDEVAEASYKNWQGRIELFKKSLEPFGLDYEQATAILTAMAQDAFGEKNHFLLPGGVLLLPAENDAIFPYRAVRVM